MTDTEAESQVESPWLPINLAPKDGTFVDLWLKPEGRDGYRVADGVWKNGEWKYYSLPEYGHSIELCTLEWQHAATHWMPLPQPPKGVK